jgi:hypothetical protein
VSAPELAERARARGLPALTALLESDAVPPLLDGRGVPVDARLDEPPHALPKALLAQLARRGPDPELVRALWPRLSSRPLERALFAADVLPQAIFTPSDPLVGELRAALRRLGPARPRAGRLGVDLNAHPAAALIAAHARDPSLARRATADLLALAYDFDLGALDELLRRRDPILDQPATRQSLHAYARLCHLAHLPSLASLYLDWLSRALGHRAAALDLCESLFDAEAPEKIPGDAIRPGDLPPPELADAGEYFIYRAFVALGDPARAQTLLQENDPKRGGPAGPRVSVVCAHLGVVFRHPRLPLEALDATVDADRLWRYASHVRAVAAAAAGQPRAMQLMHEHVGGFGNEFGAWYDFLQAGDDKLRRDAIRVVAREALALPHAPAPWKILAMSFGDKQTVHRVTSEIDVRLRAQQEA